MKRTLSDKDLATLKSFLKYRTLQNKEEHRLFRTAKKIYKLIGHKPYSSFMAIDDNVFLYADGNFYFNTLGNPLLTKIGDDWYINKGLITKAFFTIKQRKQCKSIIIFLQHLHNEREERKFPMFNASYRDITDLRILITPKTLQKCLKNEREDIINILHSVGLEINRLEKIQHKLEYDHDNIGKYIGRLIFHDEYNKPTMDEPLGLAAKLRRALNN